MKANISIDIQRKFIDLRRSVDKGVELAFNDKQEEKSETQRNFRKKNLEKQDD